MGINSYVATVVARSGLLLGGVPEYSSSRLATYKQAVQWIDQSIMVNKKVGREAMTGGIRPSTLPPEILANGELAPENS